MTFTITYRGNDGSGREEYIDAANRTECMTECRRRGIVPMSIREGRSGKSAAAPKSRSQDGASPSSRRIPLIEKVAILAAIVLAVICGAWWWLGRRDVLTDLPKESLKRVQPVEKKPTSIPTRVAKPIPMPNVTNIVTTTNKLTSRREKMIAKYGSEPITIKPGSKYKNGEKFPERRRSPFHFVSEREIDRIISCEPGKRIIGRFPKGFIDRDFKKALETPIEILPDDTEEDRAKKERMIQVKEQLKTSVAKGESLEKILEDARKEISELADFRDNMLKNLSALKKEGKSEQEIEDYYAAANKMLAEREIKPLLSPFQIREKILAVQRDRDTLKTKATPIQ